MKNFVLYGKQSSMGSVVKYALDKVHRPQIHLIFCNHFTFHIFGKEEICSIMKCNWKRKRCFKKEKKVNKTFSSPTKEDFPQARAIAIELPQ